MQKVYVVLRNLLIFFFLVAVFAQALSVNTGSLADKLIVGLVYGVFMAVIPNVLKFFKLPVNGGSLILMGLIVSFLFFFLGLYLFNFISITGKTIESGIAFIDPIVLPDKTFALVFLTIVSALFSVGMELLSKKK